MKYAYSTLALAALALAETYQVQVGPGLSYSPNSLTAAAGDIVQFKFGAGHDVVSGSFDQPCQPDGMISSGEPKDGDVFSVTITSSDPMWIYCSVPHHCQGGMAMVINPGSDGNTLDAYKSAAQDSSGSSAPQEVTGGTFGAVSESSAASSAIAADSSATSAAASSMSSASESAASETTVSGTVASASSASVAESAATAAATGEGAGGSDGAAGSLVAPLSLVLGAVMGGAALML